MATLKMKLTAGDTVSNRWAVIDDIDIVFDGTSANVLVSDHPDHSVVIWFEGPPGAKISYEITQTGISLVKGSSSISHGKRQGYVAGTFKLSN